MTANFDEKITLLLKRNKELGIKPGSNVDIARHFGISTVYVGELIRGRKTGPKANERLLQIKEYVGL